MKLLLVGAAILYVSGTAHAHAVKRSHRPLPIYALSTPIPLPSTATTTTTPVVLPTRPSTTDIIITLTLHETITSTHTGGVYIPSEAPFPSRNVTRPVSVGMGSASSGFVTSVAPASLTATGVQGWGTVMPTFGLGLGRYGEVERRI